MSAERIFEEIIRRLWCCRQIPEKKILDLETSKKFKAVWSESSQKVLPNILSNKQIIYLIYKKNLGPALEC